MCKLTYNKLCSVYWSLGSVTMLCDPEKSRNLEWDGKLVACVDYGGALKGRRLFLSGTIQAFAYESHGTSIWIGGNQPEILSDISLYKSRLLSLLGPDLSSVAFIFCFLFVFVCVCVCVSFTISWAPRLLLFPVVLRSLLTSNSSYPLLINC